MKTTNIFITLMMLFAMPVAFADDEITVITEKEYGAFEQVWDNVRLAFTFQEERKAMLMEKIQTKRQAHVEFLLAKGKIEQAGKYQEGTEKLTQQIQEKREQIIQKRDGGNSDASELEETKEQVRERIKEKQAS